MTSTVPTTRTVRTGDRRRGYRPAWATFGVVAGVAGAVSVIASGTAGAVYDEKSAGDAAALTELMSDQVPQILVFHTATMVSALAMVVFAAGLHRQLVRRLGPDSALPGTASTGLVLVAVAQLLGAGLTTEFAFGLSQPENLVPETAVFFGHWIATIPWLWVGAGLAAVVLSLAARRGAYPRWLGRTSLGFGVVILLFGISPLQYMAGMFGPLWLTIAAVALLLGSQED